MEEQSIPGGDFRLAPTVQSLQLVRGLRAQVRRPGGRRIPLRMPWKEVGPVRKRKILGTIDNRNLWSSSELRLATLEHSRVALGCVGGTPRRVARSRRSVLSYAEHRWRYGFPPFRQ